jgi:xanthine dehydrogenase large subunit
MTHVGKPIAHESAVGHVSGEARYTDDLLDRFAAVLHAWPVLSVHAHAKVLAIHTRVAAAIPGVVRVLTAADVPGQNEVGPARADEPLFPSEVLFHAQPVAWVLGETLEAAREGAAAVTVDYQPLPAILSMEQALAAESFLTEPLTIASGNIEATLAAAPRKLSGELQIGGQEHFYLETQAAIAAFDESGELIVHSSTQHPTETQHIVARVLGVANHRVTCQSLRMGGAFGGKEVQANAYAAVAAVGTWVTGRPVRVRLDRQLDMILTGKRHPFWARFQVAHDDDGRLLGMDLELFADGGWSLDLSRPIMFRAMFHCDNCYRIPSLRVVGRVLRTHKVSQTAFRGFGGPQGMVVIEDILDRVARAVGRPPHEVRARNFYQSGDVTPQPARKARARDHTGSLRHLVHDRVLQPSRRAGARVSRRFGAGQSRRHGDGPRAPHQDAADRRRHARAAARGRASDADAHRQGPQRLGDGGLERIGSQRRGGRARVSAAA